MRPLIPLFALPRHAKPRHNTATMTTEVERIIEEFKALGSDEREDLLERLAAIEIEEMDEWDAQIARDSAPGGALTSVLNRARKDIVEGRTRPLDELLDNSCTTNS